VNLRLASAVAGAIQLPIYDSNTMEVRRGGGNVGYSTEVLEQTSLQKPLTFDTVPLDWTSRWLSGLLGSRIPFDDGSNYKYRNFLEKTPALSALFLSILYFVNFYGDVKLSEFIIYLCCFSAFLYGMKNTTTIRCLPINNLKEPKNCLCLSISTLFSSLVLAFNSPQLR
jgi:hypothetical protein